MDKYEYKHLADQIQYLIDQKEYAQAVAIADTIDWRRVRSVMMLGTVSDLYKINNRYEDARDIMLMAYERKPENRQICYSLCELFIKTGEMANAVEFYKEYAQLAPKDPGQYILQYKMYEANNVSLEERAEVLESLKKREFQEKWMYELAYIYHRMELETKCVEACDELILWFGSGEYVNKALELKKLHAPLTPEQQEKYDNRFQTEEELQETEYEPEEIGEDWQEEAEETDWTEVSGDTRVFDEGEVRRQMNREDSTEDEIDNLVKIVDVGKYNTMNLQAEIAAGVNEVLGKDSITRTILEPMMDQETGYFDTAPTDEVDGDYQEEGFIEDSEAYSGQTGEPGRYTEVADYEEDISGEESKVSIAHRVMEQVQKRNPIPLESLAVQQKLEQEAMTAQPPEPMAKVLTQESDGQIRFVMPESKKLEKQITGQISIEDIRAEWEQMKQESREKQEEEVRQHVLRQTGKMFSEFEEALRDNINKQMDQQGDDSLYELSDAQQEDESLYELSEAQQEDEWSNGEETAAGVEWETDEPTDELTDGIDQIGREPGAEEISEEEESQEWAEEEAEEPQEWTEEEVEEPQEWAEEETEEPEEAVEEPQEWVEEETEEPLEEAVEEPREWAAEEVEEPLEEMTEEAEEPAEESTEESEEENGGEITGETDGESVQEEPREWTEEEAEEPLEEMTEEAEESTEESLEETAEGAADEETAENSVEEAQENVSTVRPLTKEEAELFGDLVQGRAVREQLVQAIDSVSMAAYAGNVIVTADESRTAIELAEKIVREIKMTDSNLSGVAAKISGSRINQKKVPGFIEQLKDGALIIDKASELSKETLADMYKCMQQESYGLLVVVTDTRKNMNSFLKENEKFASMFASRVDLQPLSNDVLAEYAQQYAREREFSVDDLGMLALHTRIDELQTAQHSVTKAEVEEIMNAAIESASAKSVGHFFDILLGKRYDDEDMIIITEKDFI